MSYLKIWVFKYYDLQNHAGIPKGWKNSFTVKIYIKEYRKLEKIILIEFRTLDYNKF